MRRKEYVKPCFECIMLWNGEIKTSDIFGVSIDNDLSWRDILLDPTPSDNNSIIF